MFDSKTEDYKETRDSNFLKCILQMKKVLWVSQTEQN